jgi:hypothetical protein
MSANMQGLEDQITIMLDTMTYKDLQSPCRPKPAATRPYIRDFDHDPLAIPRFHQGPLELRTYQGDSSALMQNGGETIDSTHHIQYHTRSFSDRGFCEYDSDETSCAGPDTSDMDTDTDTDTDVSTAEALWDELDFDDIDSAIDASWEEAEYENNPAGGYGLYQAGREQRQQQQQRSKGHRYRDSCHSTEKWCQSVGSIGVATRTSHFANVKELHASEIETFEEYQRDMRRCRERLDQLGWSLYGDQEQVVAL